MNYFLRIMSDDVRQHNFTKREKIVYGILYVAAIVALMGVAGWLDSLTH